MSVSCDGQYSVYDETDRTAKKEHACSACGRSIAKGESYTVICTMYEGCVSHYKRCAGCQATHEHLRDLCWDEGDCWPDEELNCGKLYGDEWGDVPDEIAALAFATPGEQVAFRQLQRARKDYSRTAYHERDLRRQWDQYHNGHRKHPHIYTAETLRQYEQRLTDANHETVLVEHRLANLEEVSQ